MTAQHNFVAKNGLAFDVTHMNMKSTSVSHAESPARSHMLFHSFFCSEFVFSDTKALLEIPCVQVEGCLGPTSADFCRTVAWQDEHTLWDNLNNSSSC